jgi:hypothetical protein
MRLVEVDVVRPEASERGVDLLADLGRRQAAVGWVVRHLAPHLGRQHIGAPRATSEDLPPGRLGCAAAIDVGGVEEVDAGLERGVGARAGLLEPHAAREGQPRAKGDLRDLQVRGAKPAVSHDAPFGAPLSFGGGCGCVLVVGDVLAPVGLGPVVAWGFGDREVSHEAVGSGAVPVPLAGRRRDDDAGAYSA